MISILQPQKWMPSLDSTSIGALTTQATSARQHSAPFTLSTIDDGPMPLAGFTDAFLLAGVPVAMYSYF
jgi:hypothetical protein